MPTFKSVEGVWFAADKETRKELKSAGIDHLGIHVSEDPYIKQMEYVTGIPRHELLKGQHKSATERMMEQMQQNQLIMTMVLAGDQEGAKKVLAQMQQKAIDDRKKSEDEAKIDPVERAREEFRASQGGEWDGNGNWVPYKSPFGKVPKKPDDLKNLPDHADVSAEKHNQVVSQSQGGFQKTDRRKERA